MALDLRHGQAESAALTKGISRLQLRSLELKTMQQRLQTEISNAIAKRETYVIKVGSWDAQPLTIDSCRLVHLASKAEGPLPASETLQNCALCSPELGL